VAQTPAALAARVLLAQQQVLLDGEAWKDVTVLRHIAKPQAGDAVAGQPGDVAPLEADAAGGGNFPHDGLDRGRAADAVAAEQTHHLTRGNVEVDALQDVALAVVG